MKTVKDKYLVVGADFAGYPLKEAVVAIDKAAAKGVYHKNTAARKVSRITKAVNSIA